MFLHKCISSDVATFLHQDYDITPNIRPIKNIRVLTCFAFNVRVMCLNELQTKLLISNRCDTCVNTLRIFSSRIQITHWWDLLTWKVPLGSAKWMLGTVGLHIPKGRSDPLLQDLCSQHGAHLGPTGHRCAPYWPMNLAVWDIAISNMYAKKRLVCICVGNGLYYNMIAVFFPRLR